MGLNLVCEGCGETVEGADVRALGAALLAHVRTSHPGWRYPDHAIRIAENYAEAAQRLTGDTKRLETIGPVIVEPVMEERLDDWLYFFDHDAFAGNPAWASCYCAEPHVKPAEAKPVEAETPWRETREAMLRLLRAGESFGYLAYVQRRPAGWVNASLRASYSLYRRQSAAEPDDRDVIGISCFLIAPPYRRHGLAGRLLDRVLSDARARGASWVEAYPAQGESQTEAANFRGPRSLFEARGFQLIEERERYSVLRRSA